MKHSSFDASHSTISALDAETSALGAATSAIARSYQRYRCGVSGDCGVGITPQGCNRVTNNGDMSTFSKPEVFQCVDSRIAVSLPPCVDLDSGEVYRL